MLVSVPRYNVNDLGEWLLLPAGPAGDYNCCWASRISTSLALLASRPFFPILRPAHVALPGEGGGQGACSKSSDLGKWAATGNTAAAVHSFVMFFFLENFSHSGTGDQYFCTSNLAVKSQVFKISCQYLSGGFWGCGDCGEHGSWKLPRLRDAAGTLRLPGGPGDGPRFRSHLGLVGWGPKMAEPPSVWLFVMSWLLWLLTALKSPKPCAMSRWPKSPSVLPKLWSQAVKRQTHTGVLPLKWCWTLQGLKGLLQPNLNMCPWPRGTQGHLESYVPFRIFMCPASFWVSQQKNPWSTVLNCIV